MDKIQQLKNIFAEMDSAIIAFSGGTDSTLVLKVAHDVLGRKAIAMTAVSASLSAADLDEAKEIAQQIGVQHILVTTEETDNPDYLANTSNRCFFCKTETYDKLVAYAQANNFATIVDGTNADDTGDHRPGRTAAKEHGVRSPLLEAGFTKADIRSLAKEYNLPNWDKPAAACLASRIPYGTTITIPMLSQVEQAEAMLHGLGIKQLRVRHHDQVARIEVNPNDFAILLEHRQEVITALKAVGYTYVTMDLTGFRSGSMNETLTD